MCVSVWGRELGGLSHIGITPASGTLQRARNLYCCSSVSVRSGSTYIRHGAGFVSMALIVRKEGGLDAATMKMRRVRSMYSLLARYMPMHGGVINRAAARAFSLCGVCLGNVCVYVCLK